LKETEKARKSKNRLTFSFVGEREGKRKSFQENKKFSRNGMEEGEKGVVSVVDDHYYLSFVGRVEISPGGGGGGKKKK